MLWEVEIPKKYKQSSWEAQSQYLEDVAHHEDNVPQLEVFLISIFLPKLTINATLVIGEGFHGFLLL